MEMTHMNAPYYLCGRASRAVIKVLSDSISILFLLERNRRQMSDNDIHAPYLVIHSLHKNVEHHRS